MTIVPDVPPSNICIACHTRIYHTPNDHHNANNQIPILNILQGWVYNPPHKERIKLGIKDASDALQRSHHLHILPVGARLYGSQGHPQGKK